jgi:hypothetical protein
MTIAYKNQFKPWKPGQNTTNELYYMESKELIWDIEDMFKVYSKSKVVIDKSVFVPGECVVNQMVLGSDNYDNDMYKIDMILRGEV